MLVHRMRDRAVNYEKWNVSQKETRSRSNKKTSLTHVQKHALPMSSSEVKVRHQQRNPNGGNPIYLSKLFRDWFVCWRDGKVRM